MTKKYHACMHVCACSTYIQLCNCCHYNGNSCRIIAQTMAANSCRFRKQYIQLHADLISNHAWLQYKYVDIQQLYSYIIIILQCHLMLFKWQLLQLYIHDVVAWKMGGSLEPLELPCKIAVAIAQDLNYKTFCLSLSLSSSLLKVLVYISFMTSTTRSCKLVHHYSDVQVCRITIVMYKFAGSCTQSIITIGTLIL